MSVVPAAVVATAVDQTAVGPTVVSLSGSLREPGAGGPRDVDAVVTALASLAEAGGPLLSSLSGACAALEATERLRRLAAVAAVDAMEAIDASRVYVDQGHASAKVMVAHLCHLSSRDAFGLDRVRRMVRDPRTHVVADCWRGGGLGVEQAVLMARVFANVRVRDAFVDQQDWFVDLAQRLPWPRFQKRVARWVDLTDTDGVTPAPDPSHERRNASLTQDHFSGAWHLNAQLGSVEGSRFHEVLTAYVDAEFGADWERAKDVHGDAVTREHLARTDAQRRADALCQMAEDAVASARPSVRVKRVHNLVWDGESAKELFRRWAGCTPQTLDADTIEVTDLDGHHLHAHHAMADLITGTFRRVIRNAARVCVDLSRDQRLFTGLARLGVELQRTTCYWPGCHRPTSHCQIDHLRPAARGGLTEQTNGAPACSFHNRLKEGGYTVTRQPDGTIHITTPNGHTVQ